MRGDLLEFQHALGVGPLVNAENQRHARGLQMRRHGFVRGQHELLDQPVRDVARRPRDAGHLAEFVEFEQRLGQIEIDRAAPLALAVQDQRQLLHQLEPLRQLRIALTQSGVAFQHSVYRGVGHALRAANHAAAEFLRHHVASGVDFEQSGQHQPVFVRTKRALIRR